MTWNNFTMSNIAITCAKACSTMTGILFNPGEKKSVSKGLFTRRGRGLKQQAGYSRRLVTLQHSHISSFFLRCFYKAAWVTRVDGLTFSFANTLGRGTRPLLACVASVSVEQRAENGVFGVLSARKMGRELFAPRKRLLRRPAYCSRVNFLIVFRPFKRNRA